MISYANEMAQRDIAMELIQALVFRQDERVADLCSQQLGYSAFLSPIVMPSLDDMADSPEMRMKHLMGMEAEEHAAHGWSPITNISLEDLLASRLNAFGTSTMCQQRIMGFMQRDNVCAIRFQEINRTGALDKTSVLRLHFKGNKIDAIDEYVDARRSFGFERAVGADDFYCSSPDTPSSPSSIWSM
jgi:hypothetical protein